VKFGYSIKLMFTGQLHAFQFIFTLILQNTMAHG